LNWKGEPFHEFIKTEAKAKEPHKLLENFDKIIKERKAMDITFQKQTTAKRLQNSLLTLSNEMRNKKKRGSNSPSFFIYLLNVSVIKK